jgi:tetratricopeptide (TPR) repeat protein
MKKLMLSFLFCTAVVSVMAQKAKVSSAEENLGKKDYDKAKADIDAALQHDKTKDDAKTFFVKGKIYEAIATEKKSLADALTAYEAYKTAIEKNPKLTEMMLEINQRMFNVYATVGNAGYQGLNSQQWDSSFTNFKKAMEISEFYNSKGLTGNIPTDTAMVFYTGYSAQQAGKKDEAFTYLKKAVDLKFKNEPALYVLLAQQYEERQDNANWLKTIEDGKTAFPADKRFNDMEMIYYSKTGKTSELLDMLEKKVAANPSDFATTLDYAIRVDNVANPRSETGTDLPKPANYDELMTKAENAYKKALELNANDATANFQLGALYFNRAVVFNKELNNLDSKSQTSPKAKELQAKVEALMGQSLPFFEKADAGFSAKGELEPADKDTYYNCLTALSKIYAIKNQSDKVESTKKKLEALK